jgi:16S rRNA processing protein RimM
MERAGVRHLVVGRLRKPHGLKGECTVFPLTDRPEAVFAAGRRLVRMALSGEVVGEAIEVERSRAYHREWLLKFRGLESRDELEAWRGQFLAAASEDLPPPAEGEVYLHELAGFAVRDTAGAALGVVTEVYDLPAGLTLEVQGPRREFLLPFRREFVREVDRPGRRLVVELPEGLVEP